MKIATYKIFLRSDTVRKDGTQSICLRVILGRRKKEFSLKLSTHSKFWDSKNCKVKNASPNSYNFNTIIEISKNRAENIIFDYRKENKHFSLLDFERSFNNANYGSDSFYIFIENEIKKDLKNKFSSATIQFYEKHISKLKKFRANLNFNDIDLNFAKEYENYMRVDLKNQESTINKTMEFIKRVCNKAIENGTIKENPLKKVSIRSFESNREHLTQHELTILQELAKSNKLKENKVNVLRYFLFACYTGLRYTDLKNLRFCDIKNIVDKQGQTQKIISIIMHKTSSPVDIPLINEAIALIGSGFEKQKVFNVLTDQPTNRYLKDIMKIAVINKSISSHCARHTFATLSLEKGIPIDVVSKLLGHKNMKTTSIYSKYSVDRKVNEMEKWN